MKKSPINCQNHIQTWRINCTKYPLSNNRGGFFYNSEEKEIIRALCDKCTMLVILHNIDIGFLSSPNGRKRVWVGTMHDSACSCFEIDGAGLVNL